MTVDRLRHPLGEIHLVLRRLLLLLQLELRHLLLQQAPATVDLRGDGGQEAVAVRLATNQGPSSLFTHNNTFFAQLKV